MEIQELIGNVIYKTMSTKHQLLILKKKLREQGGRRVYSNYDENMCNCKEPELYENKKKSKYFFGVKNVIK